VCYTFLSKSCKNLTFPLFNVATTMTMKKIHPSRALYTAEELTLDKLKGSLPKHIRDYTTQETYEKVVGMLNGDAELKRQVAQNVKLIEEGDGIRLDELVKATAFVTFRLQGMNNKEAWSEVFPELAYKYSDQFGARGVPQRAKAYANSRLVVKLMEHSIIPSWIRNHGAYQEAVDTQLDLMRNAHSETVRQKAADSLMTHLAKPEKGVPQVQIEVNETSGLNEIKEMLDSLAMNQRKSIIEGTPVKDITDIEVS